MQIHGSIIGVDIRKRVPPGQFDDNMAPSEGAASAWSRGEKDEVAQAPETHCQATACLGKSARLAPPSPEPHPLAAKPEVTITDLLTPTASAHGSALTLPPRSDPANAAAPRGGSSLGNSVYVVAGQQELVAPLRESACATPRVGQPRFGKRHKFLASLVAAITIVAVLPFLLIGARVPAPIAANGQAPWTKRDAEASPIFAVPVRAQWRGRETIAQLSRVQSKSPFVVASEARKPLVFFASLETAPAFVHANAVPAAQQAASPTISVVHNAAVPLHHAAASHFRRDEAMRPRAAAKRKPIIAAVTTRYRTGVMMLAMPDVLKPQ